MPGLEEMTAEESAQMDAMRNEQEIPQPAAAPAETPEPTPAKDPDEPEAKNGMVPHGAFAEERARRKEFQKKLEEAQSNQTRLQGRFEMLENLIRQSGQQPQAQPQIPDVNTDPVGHFKSQVEQLQRQLAEQNQWRQQQEQQSTVQTNVARIAQIAGSHEAEFKKANPDYDDASNYLRGLEDARLQAIGISDPIARANTINQTALQIAVGALQGGRNAAEAVYALAKASGYQPKAKAAAGAETSPEAKKIEMAARGQQQGGGIGATTGSANGVPTLTEIANLPDDEFDKITKGKNWQKIMETYRR